MDKFAEFLLEYIKRQRKRQQQLAMSERLGMPAVRVFEWCESDRRRRKKRR